MLLVTVAGFVACLAGISVTLFYAASDLRRRAGAEDEVMSIRRTRRAMHYAHAWHA